MPAMAAVALVAAAFALIVKSTFGLMAVMRVFAGIVVPVLVTNMPTASPEVFVQVTVALPLVVPPVTYTGAADTARPVVSPVVLAQVTVVLPVPLPAEFVTTLTRLTVLLVQSSVRRVFHVVPLSGDTWKAHWLFGERLFRSRVCT